MTRLLALAEDGEHAVEVVTDPSGFVGVLADLAWLIPVVPLAAAFAIVLIGKRLPLKGWELAEGAMGFVSRVDGQSTTPSFDETP